MMIWLKVSSGNILLVDRGGELVGVLMDFEYAKDVNAEGGAHEFRTVSVLYRQSLGSLIKSPHSSGHHAIYGGRGIWPEELLHQQD